MIKPKNTNKKRIEQTESHMNCKNKNSRKSLKMPKKQISPSNFIECLNGYLNELNNGSSERKSREEQQIEEMKRRIQKQKCINRSMQKNIIELQRILWQRTEKLDKLQQLMKGIQGKQNNHNLVNVSQNLKSKNRCIWKSSGRENSSEFEHLSSVQSESDVNQEVDDKYRRRRRTEIPNEIERMITKTMTLLPQKSLKKKN